MRTLNDNPVFRVDEEVDNPTELMHHDSWPRADIHGLTYDFVCATLADDDFYQGLRMVTVIRREQDRELFGYEWFDDISKHGESYVLSNGMDFGFECTEEDDWASYYVFEPVEAWTYEGYRIKE